MPERLDGQMVSCQVCNKVCWYFLEDLPVSAAEETNARKAECPHCGSAGYFEGFNLSTSKWRPRGKDVTARDGLMQAAVLFGLTWNPIEAQLTLTDDPSIAKKIEPRIQH